MITKLQDFTCKILSAIDNSIRTFEQKVSEYDQEIPQSHTAD